jgi:hypothetical protein
MMPDTFFPNRKSLLRAGKIAAWVLCGALTIAAAGNPAPGGDVTIYGRPMLTVSAAVVGPRPGSESAYPRIFDVQLTVDNIGSITASHVVGTVPANEYVGTENGSGIFGFTYIYPGKSATTTLHLQLDKVDPGGRVQPVIHFVYYEHNDEDDVDLKFTGDEPVRLNFGDPGWDRPVLLIESAATDPAIPAPGDSCELNIRLADLSAGDAKQVLIRLGGDEGPKPFATVGSGNIGHIDQIRAGKSAEASFPLVVDGSAAAGLYPVQVTLSYQNVLGEKISDNPVIYLKVQNRPALQADLTGELPSPILVGEPFDFPVEVINIGRQSLNAGTIELTSDRLTLTNNTIYAGPLDESTSTSLVATAVADQPGPAEVTLTVHYLDEFNQPQTWTHAFSLTVADNPAPAADAAPAEEGSSVLEKIWKAILAFLGFGG